MAEFVYKYWLISETQLDVEVRQCEVSSRPNNHIASLLFQQFHMLMYGNFSFAELTA